MDDLLPERPSRVLVVDDCPDTRTSLHMLLNLWGFEVREAADGPGALRAAAEFEPDTVLLDVGLPGMSGYEVARRLRQTPDLRGVLIVALTGFGRDSDADRARQAGADLHFVKPIDPDLLRVVVGGPVPCRLP